MLGEVRGAARARPLRRLRRAWIEALSRGADSATFVDRDAAAVDAIRRNLEALGVAGAVVRRQDALRFLLPRQRARSTSCSSTPRIVPPPPGRSADRSPPGGPLRGRSDRDRIGQADAAATRAPARPRTRLRRYADRDPPAAELKRGTAVCPGSYDPVTMGHLDIIGRAADVFDQRDRRGGEPAGTQGARPLFTSRGARRVHSRRSGFGQCAGKAFDKLLVDFAREHGAKAIVKGLRAISDFEYEFEMNQLNRKMAPTSRAST